MLEIKPTPVEYFGTEGDCRIHVKREDLIPFSFGGNKVRIAAEVCEEAEKRGCRRIISYGSATSNLNRVIAHMAGSCGLGCTLVIREESSLKTPSFNELMALSSGAEVVYTAASEVRQTVGDVIRRYEAVGENPYYVYGDETGKGGEEVLNRAYEKAAEEILKQEEELQVCFDTVVLPVGTGATLSGLLAGFHGRKKILGISVARSVQAVLDGLPAGPGRECLTVTEEYLQGGYGRYGREETDLILQILREKGMVLDPVYSGKAFFGMMKEAGKGNLTGDVLFLHTGGTPLFFDMMEQL